jgi:ferric-dicitrate binding protein FerR (iron transport regulator)
MTDLQTLLEAACNSDLSPEQAAQFEPILRDDPEARAMYLRYLALDAELALEFGYVGRHAIVAQPATITLTAPAAASEPIGARRLPSILVRRPRGRFWSAAAVLGVAVVLAVGATVAILALQDRHWEGPTSVTPPAGPGAFLAEFQGEVKIVVDKDRETPAVGMSLVEHEVSVGPASFAVIRFADGTSLKLLWDSEVFVHSTARQFREDGDKGVLFERGELDVEAKGGSPGHELVVHTAGMMVVRTADARFIVTQTPRGYYVEVSKGEVEVKAMPDLQPDTVPAGACVEVTYQPFPEIRAVDRRERRGAP